MPCRRLWLLALCPLLGCSSAAPPTPTQALAQAKGRCSVPTPGLNELERLDPLSTASPAGGLMNPDLSEYRGFFALARPPVAARESDGYPLELRLRAKPVVSPAEPLGIELQAVNRSGGKLTLMHPIDGSDAHWRYPFYDLYVRPENSYRTYALASVGARCGNVNAIGAEDYLELRPGEASEPAISEWSEIDRARLLSPGRYVLWVVYRHCGFGASVDPQSGVLLGESVVRGDVLEGEYASNPVTVEVR
ncbi:MAG TPA: hypothetical protein VFS43_18835 [Polyangiaceae bacterium]|nr:hypothetical protein [Polyangiaceae bacterium]